MLPSCSPPVSRRGTAESEREWADRPPKGTAGQHSLCSRAGQDAGRPDKVVAAKEIVHNTNIKVQEQLV